MAQPNIVIKMLAKLYLVLMIADINVLMEQVAIAVFGFASNRAFGW